MNIQFLGAAETVTGSKYHIQAGHTQLLVDCGLFQGYKTLRLRNWAPLSVDPAKLDCVLLTHAHIDHSGYIPLLVKNGFKGKILCTEATKDLCRILLPDSGYLAEEEARYANRHHYSKHETALPLYTKKEAEHALSLFHSVPREKPISLSPSLSATFYSAGHILGASFIQIRDENTTVLFSGDLGGANDPILFPPSPPPRSDFLIVESTYGDRLHAGFDPSAHLKSIINRTVKRGGSVIIPAFAVGRTQTMLYYLHALKSKGEIPDIPIYVDSPMASRVTDVLAHTKETCRLTQSALKSICESAFYVDSVEASVALDHQKVPIILISASGMATGGRVLHHLRHFAPDHRNTILFTGFQVPGTRGDRMLRGEQTVKILGQMISIRAEVLSTEHVSAHGDYADILHWLSFLPEAPQKIFLTHGQPEAAQSLKNKIEQQFHWSCEIPSYLETAQLVARI